MYTRKALPRGRLRLDDSRLTQQHNEFGLYSFWMMYDLGVQQLDFKDEDLKRLEQVSLWRRERLETFQEDLGPNLTLNYALSESSAAEKNKIYSVRLVGEKVRKRQLVSGLTRAYIARVAWQARYGDSLKHRTFRDWYFNNTTHIVY